MDSHPAEVDSNQRNPVFVSGVFRSGTSLLYALLNRHPELALMFESSFWDFPQTLSPMRFRSNWLERQEFFNQTLSRHRLIFGNSLKGLEKVRTPGELYHIYGEGKGARFWGEKSPFYCVRLRQLAKQYPSASFILIWRDPLEIYRSVILAGRKSPFFRRRGMLSRLIFHQEEMIRQAAELEFAGARIFHVTYDELVDQTEKVCRGISEFLGIEFEAKMLDLSHADLSAIYPSANHNYLRRGVIERQQFNGETVVKPDAVEKLHRFRARWDRLTGGRFAIQKNFTASCEPSWFESARHRFSGEVLFAKDQTKRALFEFLPLTWLRTYRVTKTWFKTRRAELPVDRRSLGEQFRAHWITIITSFLVLAGVALIHCHSNPRFTLLPFYMIPCAILALVVNRRWGTFAALTGSFIGPALLSEVDSDFASCSMFLWNWAMRFVVLEILVLLLDRIRVEAAATSEGS